MYILRESQDVEGRTNAETRTYKEDSHAQVSRSTPHFQFQILQSRLKRIRVSLTQIFNYSLIFYLKKNFSATIALVQMKS